METAPDPRDSIPRPNTGSIGPPAPHGPRGRVGGRAAPVGPRPSSAQAGTVAGVWGNHVHMSGPDGEELYTPGSGQSQTITLAGPPDDLGPEGGDGDKVTQEGQRPRSGSKDLTPETPDRRRSRSLSMDSAASQLSAHTQAAVHEARTAWVRSFPSKLRLLRGKPKYVAGFLLQFSLLSIFLLTLFWTANQCNSSKFVSGVDSTKHSSTQNTTCRRPAREFTERSVWVTEGNVWSNDPERYEEIQALKQVDFLSYEATPRQHRANVEKINECIDDMNAFTRDHTSIFNLLEMNWHPCFAGNMTVSAPVHWPFVFDATLVNAYHPDLKARELSRNLTYEQVMDICSTSAKRVGDIVALSIDCTPTCREGSPDAEKLCSEMYFGDNSTKAVTTLSINPDSLARCLAVNHGILPWDDGTDLIVTLNATNLEIPQIIARDASTDFSNEIVLSPSPAAPAINGCALFFKAFDETDPDPVKAKTWLRPTVEYDTPGCNEVACATYEPSTECSFQEDAFDFRVNLTEAHGGGQVVLNIFGGLQGLLNKNQFTFYRGAFYEGAEAGEASTFVNHPSCRPLLTHLTDEPPEDLAEAFWECQSKTCPSWTQSMGTAFANATLVEELLLGAVVVVFVYLARQYYKDKGPTLAHEQEHILTHYDDEDLELATLEASVERLRLKEDLKVPTDKLFFKQRGMRHLGSQPAWHMGATWKPGDHNASMTSLKARMESGASGDEDTKIEPSIAPAFRRPRPAEAKADGRQGDSNQARRGLVSDELESGTKDEPSSAPTFRRERVDRDEPSSAPTFRRERVDREVKVSWKE